LTSAGALLFIVVQSEKTGIFEMDAKEKSFTVGFSAFTLSVL
jgi:hypothetical protein